MSFADLQSKLDSSDMYSEIGRFVDVFSSAFSEGRKVKLPPEFLSAKMVLGLGMGGSGMGYKLLRSLSQHFGNVPLEIVSDYNLPAYITTSTIVFSTSFSGNTEETLSATEQAVNKKLPVVCLTTGGRLADYAKENHLPLFQFNYPVAPRVGLPYTFGAALGMFVESGLLNLPVSQIESSFDEVRNLMKNWQSPDSETNPASELAKSLVGKQVFVIGGGIMESVAIRWKGQMNENAKTISFTEPMPEMCHNMILGFQNPASARKESAVVFLTSPFDHPRYAKRYQIIGSLFEKDGSLVYEAASAAKSSLFSSLLSQIIFGDYVSYYLALLNGVDPVEMERIDYLKQRLSA